jgi:hypothetical protein
MASVIYWVFVFTVNYDAPYPGECKNITNPYNLMPSIVQLYNSTILVSGLRSNASVAKAEYDSKATVTITSLTTTGSATPGNDGARSHVSLGSLVLGMAFVSLP